ncbi:MAG: hypothetical protein RL164_217 [Bacteroidota bacterium]|jgi:DNA-binding NarL/FixJ family response regulator
MPNKTMRFAIIDIHEKDADLLAELQQNCINVFLVDIDMSKFKDVKQIKNLTAEEIKQLLLSDEQKNKNNLQAHQNKKGFTDRELKVLISLCDGLTSKEIGEQLYVSKKTVDLIRTKLLKAYQVKTSNELIRLSIIDGLYTPRTNYEIELEKEQLAQQQQERRILRLQGKILNDEI